MTAPRSSRSIPPKSCAPTLRTHRDDLHPLRPRCRNGPLSIPDICAIAKEKGVPVFVDAAAEEPLVPNIHIPTRRHAGRLLRAASACADRSPPACSSARKISAAPPTFQAAPHHNYGRAYKCSKEEVMGLLAAVRQWYKRDHAAEQARVALLAPAH